MDKRRLREYAEGYHAADPELMSMHAFLEAEEAAEKSGTRQFRLVEGYQALLDWMCAELDSHGASVRCSHVVKRVRWQRHAAAVEVQTPQHVQVLHSSHVLVTLPVAVLKSTGAGAVFFEPELKRPTESLAGFEMGDVNKIVLEFDARFWPVENFGFVHAFDESSPTWWADERGCVLTGWAGGPKARHLTAQDPSTTRRHAVRALATIFSVDPARVEAHVQSLHGYDWRMDPFSGGAYSYLRAGAANAPCRLAASVEDTIYFAGEATATPGEQGTVHGAIESGRRVAREIVEARA